MKLSPLACAIALLPCVSFAQVPTQNQALLLPDSLITANREVQARNQSTSANTVFTRSDIDRLRPANVLELVSYAPGVQVATQGGRGSDSGLYIRGTSAAQTLILVDGVRFKESRFGKGNLQYIPMDQVERVEVLRGSRSAIYGADALGGVVQIFTRRGAAQGLHPTLRVASGSHGTLETSLGVSGGNDKTRFSLNSAFEETEGFNRTGIKGSLNQDDDAYRNRSISASLNHQLTDSIDVGFSLLDQRGESEYDDTWGSSKPYNEFRISSVSTFVNAAITDAWNTRVELAHSENRQKDLNDTNASVSFNNEYQDSVSWLNSLTLDEQNSLRIGAEYVNEKLRNSMNLGEPSRKNTAAYAQHSFTGNLFSTELGIRHDKNEQFGSENTFNAALTVPVNDTNQLIASYAEGFRVPTFMDLYSPYAPAPELQPERSKSYELQWRSQLSDTALFEASLYQSDIRDLIALDPSAGWKAGNINQARIHGFEASLKQQWLGWHTDLNLSIIDPRDVESGHILPNRAKRTLNFNIDRKFGDFGVGASFKAVSKSYADAANNNELGGYGVLDLRASWQANSELGFDVKWANVLDKEYKRIAYSYPHSYRETPSSVMFGMTWTPSF